jgi:trimeric autotransporter adhesin
VYASSTYQGVEAFGTYYGVVGYATNAAGVYGSGPTGVYGYSITGSGYGTYGYAKTGVGTFGATTSGYGVYGVSDSTTAGAGVYGLGVTGVIAVSNEASSGLYATSNGGWAVNAYGTDSATGVLAGSDYGYAAWFNGDVNVDGNLSKNAGSFKIDHPLDPANKYLYHSFVESPDMMNIYNGNVTTNAQGEAVVTLPKWFETLNRDFRYQLTVMGQFAQAIVSGKVANHQFAIKTDKPNVEVSWQVTGIRQDAWANAHRIPVEEMKPENERGFYQHPELYGAPKEKSIMWARFPKAMKQWKETPAKPAMAKSAPPAQLQQ